MGDGVRMFSRRSGIAAAVWYSGHGGLVSADRREYLDIGRMLSRVFRPDVMADDLGACDKLLSHSWLFSAQRQEPGAHWAAWQRPSAQNGARINKENVLSGRVAGSAVGTLPTRALGSGGADGPPRTAAGR